MMLQYKTLSLLFIFGCLISIGYTGAYEHPLVVVIPSYNNAEWYQKNLDSVFMQSYENYRVIYIEDCSPDGTFDLIKAYVREHKQDHRVTVLKNKKRRGALANHFKAVHLCDDREIVIQLDGDDWFTHEDVLSRINEAYQDPNVWITYGQYEIYPIDKIGLCKSIPDQVITHHAYREYVWVTSAPRTCYAGLFKQIKLKDLLYEGDFFAASCDLAFMYPMLEMAAGRIKFIDEVLYIYNCETPQNDFKQRLLMQLNAEYVVRGRSKYEPLSTLPNSAKGSEADLIIFSQDNPAQLSMLLQSVFHYMPDISSVSVLYVIKDDHYNEYYTECAVQFPFASFVNIEEAALNRTLLEMFGASSSTYVLFAQDNFIIKDYVDITQCIKYMKQTHAYGFFLGLGKNIRWSSHLIRKQEKPYLIPIDNDVYAWQFMDGEGDWRRYNNWCLTLYEKSVITSQLKDLHVTSFQDLVCRWTNASVDLDHIGLCFRTSKGVGINIEKSFVNDTFPSLIKRCLEAEQPFIEKIKNGINSSLYIEANPLLFLLGS